MVLSWAPIHATLLIRENFQKNNLKPSMRELIAIGLIFALIRDQHLRTSLIQLGSINSLGSLSHNHLSSIIQCLTLFNAQAPATRRRLTSFQHSRKRYWHWASTFAAMRLLTLESVRVAAKTGRTDLLSIHETSLKWQFI